ncbi:MAG: TonB-dependent receptor, partial [Pseudomonadota bacterium]
IILDFNPSTLSDVFDAIPGAQFDSGPRRTGDAPTIRGLSGNGVLIFLDGARQSFISGHDGRFFVDPELVRAVEVVRGPTSALYGSGALGGVISTRTITARDILGEGETVAVRLNAGYQSVNNEFRVGGTGVWQAQDGLFDVVGHLTYRESGNIELGNDFSLPADDEIVSSLLKLTVRPADDLEIYASWLRFNADSTDPQNPQGVNLAGPGNALVFRDAQNQTFQGGVNWNPQSDFINFNAVGYYSDNAVEEDEVEMPRTTDRQVETFGFLLDNRSLFSLGGNSTLTFTYGGEYYRDEQTGLDTATADGTRGGVPDATTDFYGLFIQADLALVDTVLPGELHIIPGVRWDRFETSQPSGTFDIAESEFSPKVGLTYKPVPEFLIFGNYAQGFRAPSFNEAFADGVHFSVPNLSAPPGPFGPTFVQNLFIGNADLTSENSTTWEVGTGFDFENVLSDGDRLTAKGSYYRSDVDNLIGLDVNTPLGCFFTPQTAPPGIPPFVLASMPCGTGPAFGNTSQNVNIANADIDGVEVEFRYDSDYFYLRGNLSTINGVDADTGEFLEGVLSPNTVFVDGGFKHAGSGLRAGLRLTFAQDFDEVNEAAEARDGYTVGDVYAVWEPPIKELEGVRIDLGIDNFTDQDFEVVFAGVSQPGRNYKATISWTKGF